MRVDPAIRMLLLELPAAIHHLGRATHGETRRDRIEVAALAMVALDQPVRLAVEVIRRDADLVGRQSGRCRSGPKSHMSVRAGPASSKNSSVETGLLVVKARQVVVPPQASSASKNRGGRRTGIIAVAVLHLLGKDPFLQPIEQLIPVGPKDAAIAESGCARR